MTHYRLTAVIWKEGKRFVSKCPELGVASFGPTPEASRTALAEAVELYLSNAKKLGLLPGMKSVLTAKARFTAPLEIAIA